MEVLQNKFRVKSIYGNLRGKRPDKKKKKISHQVNRKEEDIFVGKRKKKVFSQMKVIAAGVVEVVQDSKEDVRGQRSVRTICQSNL